MGLTVQFAKEVIAPERLQGFLQTVWRPTLEPFRARHMKAIEILGQAKAAFEGRWPAGCGDPADRAEGALPHEHG